MKTIEHALDSMMLTFAQALVILVAGLVLLLLTWVEHSWIYWVVGAPLFCWFWGWQRSRWLYQRMHRDYRKI